MIGDASEANCPPRPHAVCELAEKDKACIIASNSLASTADTGCASPPGLPLKRFSTFRVAPWHLKKSLQTSCKKSNADAGTRPAIFIAPFIEEARAPCRASMAGLHP